MSSVRPINLLDVERSVQSLRRVHKSGKVRASSTHPVYMFANRNWMRTRSCVEIVGRVGVLRDLLVPDQNRRRREKGAPRPDESPEGSVGGFLFEKRLPRIRDKEKSSFLRGKYRRLGPQNRTISTGRDGLPFQRTAIHSAHR